MVPDHLGFVHIDHIGQCLKERYLEHFAMGQEMEGQGQLNDD